MPVFAALLLALHAAPPAEGQDGPRSPLAWPAGPLEVRIAFDEPVGEAEAMQVAGRTIPFRSSAPPEGQGGDPGGVLGSLRIAGADLRDGGRTLALLTDPHPVEASYAPDLPEGLGRPAYDLSGVEASWTAEGDEEPSWVGWLPELDLGRSRDRTAASAEHGQAFARMIEPGTLTLRTLLDLPEGEIPIVIAADRPFEAEVAFLPLEVGEDSRAEGVVESFGEPAELYLAVPTGGEAGGGLPELTVSIRPGSGEADRPVDRSELVLPWAPATPVGPSEVPPLRPELAGGDPARGEAVFFGDQGKCADCHRVGDRGGLVGPDLTTVGDRLDPAALHHAIEAPSAAIAPEYLPYTVAMLDGRVFVGVVRAEGAESIRVVGSDAQAVDLPRSEIEEIRPVATSIMPVGLAGALGQSDLRDLLAYLSGRRGGASGERESR